MKLFVDEIPVLTSDCPFFDLKNCKIGNTKCEHMELPSKERCYQHECKWLKELE